MLIILVTGGKLYVENDSFDLDGTLLPMDQEVFTKDYFKRLAAKLLPHGYQADQLVDGIWAGTAAMVKTMAHVLMRRPFGAALSRFFW